MRVNPNTISRLLIFSSSILSLCFTDSLRAQNLDDLQRIQAQIQNTVAMTTAATVVVSDGIGSGSGVVVSPDGLVLTAGHVLMTGGTNFRVTFPDGRQVAAKPLGKNLDVDAAMIRISDPGPWPYVELGNSDQLKVGDWCVCLGHSGGYDLGRVPPVRAGKILAVKKTQCVTDCALIGGDSGGPLFDLNGRLIGIHSSISYDSVAINRHVLINTFRQHWDRMLAGSSWGRLPELTNEDDENLRARAGLGVTLDQTNQNAVISLVKPGSAAEAAGLARGDKVVEFDGTDVKTWRQLIDLVKTKDPGDMVIVRVDRNGESAREFQLKLEQIGP